MGGEIAILGKIAEYLVAPVGRQLGYLFCFNKNVENLREEAEKLKNVREGVLLRVEKAKRNVEKIIPEVEAWVNNAHQVWEDAEGIVQDKAKAEMACFINLKMRYTLSRKANKKAQVVVKLLRDGKFDQVSVHAPPPAIEGIISVGGFKGFQSRFSTMNEIIESLKDDKIQLIGICGMAGVGKTTMAKEVVVRAKEENLFDEIAMSVVSQSQDLTRVQIEIAEELGLKLVERNPFIRASRLHARILQNGNKRILVVLDDVWEEFDLQEMGIHQGCKIAFTSRNQNLWNGLETKRDIPLKILFEDEALHLFIEKSGDFTQDPHLRQIGQEIVKQCAGLPLALVVVGGALRNTSTHTWRDMLRVLSEPGTEGTVAGVSRQVYVSIELSISFLSEKLQSLFLLCCLFPEDYVIYVEQLVKYGIGLQLLGITQFEKARGDIYVAVDKLKDCNLLLDGGKHGADFRGNVHGGGLVKMHDVIRNVGIAKASRGNLVTLISHGNRSEAWSNEGTYDKYNFISVTCHPNAKVPKALKCPNLELLRLECERILYDVRLKMPRSFLVETGEVRVLDMICVVISNPLLELVNSKNLRTLCLERCRFANTILIGELLNLEILSFKGSNFSILPPDIGKLEKLKLLDISDCYKLKRISAGILSSLSQLQELYMLGGFTDWEPDKVDQEGRGGKGKELKGNASLNELESLSNLTTLTISIPNASLLRNATLITFASLKTFRIDIREPSSWWLPYVSQRTLHLKLDKSIKPLIDLNVIERFLRRTDVIFLQGKGSEDWVNALFQVGIQDVKILHVADSNTPDWLVKKMDWVPYKPILEYLYLERLPTLREICHIGCDVTNKLIEFPKLFQLDLRSLPRFESFCHGVDKIHFPQLKDLSLSDLPNVNWLFSTNTKLLSKGNADSTSSMSIFPLKVSIPNLEELRVMFLPNLEGLAHGSTPVGFFGKLGRIYIRGCDKMLHIFPYHLLPKMQNLVRLQIINCRSLEKVFELEKNYIEEEDLEILPQMEYMTSRRLPKLNHVTKGQSECDMISQIAEESDVEAIIDFPQLQRLKLCNLPSLESFLPKLITIEAASNVKIKKALHSLLGEKVTFPCLEKLKVHSVGKIEGLACNRHPVAFLPRLKFLRVEKCDGLRFLFSPTAVKSIQRLKKLKISDCNMMLGIVTEEIGQDDYSGVKVELPHLKILKIFDLPNLASFFPNVTLAACASNHSLQYPVQALFNEKVEFPNLEKLMLKGLHKVNGIWSNHLFGSLNKLVSLKVGSSRNLQNLLSPSIARSLVHLRDLFIYDCQMMEQVIANDKDEEVDLFAQLKALKLQDLPQLEIFYHVTHDWKLPLLSSVIILNCHKFKTFSPGLLLTPSLQTIKVEPRYIWRGEEGARWIWKGDLNSSVQHFFKQKERERERRTNWKRRNLLEKRVVTENFLGLR